MGVRLRLEMMGQRSVDVPVLVARAVVVSSGSTGSPGPWAGGEGKTTVVLPSSTMPLETAVNVCPAITTALEPGSSVWVPINTSLCERREAMIAEVPPKANARVASEAGGLLRGVGVLNGSKVPSTTTPLVAALMIWPEKIAGSLLTAIVCEATDMASPAWPLPLVGAMGMAVRVSEASVNTASAEADRPDGGETMVAGSCGSEDGAELGPVEYTGVPRGTVSASAAVAVGFVEVISSTDVLGGSMLPGSSLVVTELVYWELAASALACGSAGEATSEAADCRA